MKSQDKKHSRQFKRPLLTTLLCLSSLLLTCCSKTNDGSPERCFSKSSLEDTPWVKSQLQFFQAPKMGPVRVVVYTYQGVHYLAFENPTLSSPMSYIFDCAGIKLPALKINYNDFYKGNREVEVLLIATY